MDNYICINNKILPAREAMLHVSDLSIQRGYGIFDYFKVINNRPIFLDDHLDRFYNSAREMLLEVIYTRDELKAMIFGLIGRNNIPDSGIKMLLTGGYSTDGYTMTGTPNLIIQQSPLVIKDYSDEGMRLMTWHHQRQIPQAKNIDYVQAIRLQSLMKESGADDILYYYNNIIGESPRSNFFIVTDTEVLTAENNILHGINRKKILEMSISGYTIVARDFTLDDLFAAREAFITSTTKQAYPVVMVDGKSIGNGQPGPVTRQINAELFRLMALE